MYIRPNISLKKLLIRAYKPLIAVLLYTTLIYRLYDFRGIEALDIPMSISTVLGFAVALLLGFRTSEAYDRWWEARKIWGAIVNDSRTLSRQLIGFLGLDERHSIIKEISYCTIAWNYALKNTLRNLDIEEEIRPFLSQNDTREVMSHQNVPNAILLLMEKKIRELKSNESLTIYEFVELDKSIKRLCDHMGKCERINNTYFPVHYRYFTHIGIIIYIVMLPFGMLKSTGLFMIPIVILVFYFFSSIEHIAHILQDPFKNRGSDTPISSLSRTIELNLKQMLGETELPDSVVADQRGAIM